MPVPSPATAFWSALLLLLAISPFALAASGDLEAPALTMAKGYPAADYAKVKAVLGRGDCKFLGGGWLNK